MKATLFVIVSVLFTVSSDAYSLVCLLSLLQIVDNLFIANRIKKEQLLTCLNSGDKK